MSEIPPMDEVDAARRIAFILANAEQALGIDRKHLSFRANLAAVLGEAMQHPSAIDAQTYRVVFCLHEAWTEPIEPRILKS